MHLTPDCPPSPLCAQGGKGAPADVAPSADQIQAELDTQHRANVSAAVAAAVAASGRALLHKCVAYDSWVGTVERYTLDAPPHPPPTDYFEALLSTVPADSVSVAVVVHALVEQVARLAVDQSLVDDAEEHAAKQSAEQFLSQLFAGGNAAGGATAAAAATTLQQTVVPGVSAAAASTALSSTLRGGGAAPTGPLKVLAEAAATPQLAARVAAPPPPGPPRARPPAHTLASLILVLCSAPAHSPTTLSLDDTHAFLSPFSTAPLSSPQSP